jgi:uncharacterized protein YecE (DUF72 family)
MAGLWIGTSGWSYPHWRESFYPAALPSRRWLAFYADHFASVEINASFYRLPPRAAFAAWRDQTPPGFRFAVKGSRYLTHLKKLIEPEEPLRRLLDAAAGLGDKLGPLLFQLPPRWRLDLPRLERFLAALRAQAPAPGALEFRDPSWLSPPVFAALERAGVALCLPVGPGMPLDVRLTAGWTYLRMHHGRQGIGFGDDELAAWAERIAGFLARGAETYVYFNNDPGGHAVRDAQRLRRLLGGP